MNRWSSNLLLTIFVLIFIGVNSYYYSTFFKIDDVSLTNVAENHPDVLNVENMIDRTTIFVYPVIKKKIAMAIVSNGKYYDVDFRHLVAIAFVESGFRPNLINETGDYGVFQVNWFWHGKKYAKNPKDLLNVYKNTETACKIIASNRKMGYTNLASYHSFNPDRQAEYGAKLKNALRRL